MRTVSPSLVVHRYPEYRRATSPRDALHAVVGQIGFLASHEYLTNLLSVTHGVSRPMAARRAKSLIPHVTAALAYVDQAYAGPAEVRFLPAYYAILNLIKVYILLSPRYAELPANRWHGAQYKTYDKESRSLLTEQIYVKRGGALPLFYEVVTQKRWGAEKCVAMKDVYPYIADTAAEWEMAVGKKARLAGIRSTVHSDKGRELIMEVGLPDGARSITRRDLPALRGVQQDAAKPWIFRRTIPDLSQTPIDMVSQAIDPLYVYHPHAERTIVAINAHRTVIFEEWPIALAYFHMSSVVRYKPEFLARVRNSRHWPVAAALSDALFRFLVLALSFAHKTTMVFERE